MLGEVRPLLGVVGLDQARDELDATEIPEEVGRYMVAIARQHAEHPRRRARSELARDHAPRERREGERAPVRPDRGRDRGRARDRAVRPPPPLIVDDGLTPDDVLRTVLEQVPVPEPAYTLR